MAEGPGGIKPESCIVVEEFNTQKLGWVSS